MTNADPAQRDFTLSWTLDATPAEVFRAWTDPDHLQWFYNDQQPVPSEPIELDLRVGGAWRQRMVVDDDTEFVTGGVYREIVQDQKLVFVWGAVDGWPALDLERLDDAPLVTVTLDRVADRTKLTLLVELPSGLPEDRVQEWLALGIRDGWRGTVDRLATAFAHAAATAPR